MSEGLRQIPVCRTSGKSGIRDFELSPANEKDLHRILDRIYRVTGFNAHQYRSSTLRRRLQLRLYATGSESYKDYYDIVLKDASECNNFLDVLMVNVTEFFRDKRVFSNLEKKTLPEMLEELTSKKRKRVRIWSVGCSRGQEAYSIAFVLHEKIKENGNGLGFLITATDVDRDVLEQARRARYSREEVQNIPKEYVREYFVKTSGDEFAVKETIKKSIRFKHHDLINGKPLGRFDLVLCRNLFIFFEQQLQSKMMKKIHASLTNDGILVMGTAESLKGDRLFRCVSSRDHIYKKI